MGLEDLAVGEQGVVELLDADCVAGFSGALLMGEYVVPEFDEVLVEGVVLILVDVAARKLGVEGGRKVAAMDVDEALQCIRKLGLGVVCIENPITPPNDRVDVAVPLGAGVVLEGEPAMPGFLLALDVAVATCKAREG